MSAWTELRVRDRLMDTFIKADPIGLTLHRPVWVDQPDGGKAASGSDTIAEQQFGLYPFKRRLTQEYHFNPQTYGEEKVEFIHYVLIFNRGHDIQVDDTFDPDVDLAAGPGTGRLQGGLYVVTFISARLWDRGQAGILYRG